MLLAREMDDHVEFHAQEADLPDDGTSTAEVAGPELLVPEPAEVAPRTEAREREREQQQRHRNPPPVSSRQAHAIQFLAPHPVHAQVQDEAAGYRTAVGRLLDRGWKFQEAAR